MTSETAASRPETSGLEEDTEMKPARAAAWVARLIGLLTLGWVYLAYTDLRWLLHLHKVHSLVTHAPFAFSYNPYLACTIANAAAAVTAACVLLLFPTWMLRVLTPASGKAWALSTGWRTTGIAMGLVLLVLSMQSFWATTLWTIYSSGRNAGWQMNLLTSVVVAVGGIVLCRKILAGRRAA